MFEEYAADLLNLSQEQVNWIMVGLGLIAAVVLIILLDIVVWLYRKHQIVLIVLLLGAALFFFVVALSPIPDVLAALLKSLMDNIEVIIQQA